uniref:Spy/CpxP family protein refolding chaperone n=1 Tax=Ningiella ruwaisensis TaxID=2364274 RepID=UPI0010A03986|nr:Spy/CpxP family protein refolding chaperone [Ningiella ruwaisensis]
MHILAPIHELRSSFAVSLVKGPAFKAAALASLMLITSVSLAQSPYKLFERLDLTQAQQQDIRQILSQTKADNAIYRGERDTMQSDMQVLMQKSSWDAQLAQQIVSTRVDHSTEVALNIANAKHEAYSLLSNEQKAELAKVLNNASDMDKRAKPGNRERRLDIMKLAKRLDVSDSQLSQLQAIKEQQQSYNQAHRSEFKTFKDAEQTLIFSDEFNTDAWLALQAQQKQAKIELGVQQAYFQYQMLSVLDDSQRETLQTMMENMKNRDGKKPKRERNHQLGS